MEDALFFGIQKWGEFGQRRIRETLNPNEKRRISFVVPRGSWMCIIKWRFGDLNTNVFNFRFDNCRNAWEQNILLGQELINFVTEPFPYIIASGSNGAIVIENTDNASRNFEMVYDFVLLNNEIAGKLREIILKDKQVFRGNITQGA